MRVQLARVPHRLAYVRHWTAVQCRRVALHRSRWGQLYNDRPSPLDSRVAALLLMAIAMSLVIVAAPANAQVGSKVAFKDVLEAT